MHGYERFGITIARALKYVTRKYAPYTARKIAAVESAVALKNGYALGVALTIGLNQREFGIDSELHYNSQAAVFGQSVREMYKLLKLQGAGSVKRDSTIWDEYLKSTGVAYTMVAPVNNRTKMTADSFRRTTGYTGRTNEHNRDAAMLVFGM